MSNSSIVINYTVLSFVANSFRSKCRKHRLEDGRCADPHAFVVSASLDRQLDVSGKSVSEEMGS